MVVIKVLFGILFLHQMLITVLAIDFSFFWPTSKPTENVEIDLGFIEGDYDEECIHKISGSLQNCKQNYKKKLDDAWQKAQGNINSESLRKIRCCGAWETKQCAIKATEEAECDPRIIDQIRNLPNDTIIRETVLDICSEYRENSTICIEERKSFLFSMNSLILFIVIMVTIAVIVMVVNFLMEKYRNGKIIQYCRPEI